jgi:hypothetical protein
MSAFSKATLSFISCLLVSFALMSEAKADGTEQLGPPSIPIAPGSQIVVEGTGLINAQPGIISIEIPANVSIAQVLLYWTGRSVDAADAGNDDTIQVNGEDVTAPRIGGPTLPPFPSNTYRADITAMSDALNWIVAGQVNFLSVEGLDFTYSNDGAGVVVILDDGSVADIQIMDGNDFAYLPHGYETVPVSFPVAPSPQPRIGTLWLMVSDIDVPRPAAVEITVGGITTQLNGVLLDNEGDFMDVVELEVPVPPGVSNVTVRVLSIADGFLQPASLAWNFVSWEIAVPGGCTYTIGYWKNHPDDWPTDELSLFGGKEAMEILWSPTKGNAFIILAHQYIGAELNVVNGTAIPNEVLAAWYLAQDLLVKYMGTGVIPKHTDDRELAIYLAGVLDDYNNGLFGPPHCD